MNMTPERLQELTDYWQDRLRLAGWDIRPAITRQCDFTLDEAQGESQYSFTGSQAIIRILDEQDYPSKLFPQDQEKTLVHELLHLRFASIPVKGPLIDIQHQFLDDLSKALVEARRTAGG